MDPSTLTGIWPRVQAAGDREMPRRRSKSWALRWATHRWLPPASLDASGERMVLPLEIYCEYISESRAKFRPLTGTHVDPNASIGMTVNRTGSQPECDCSASLARALGGWPSAYGVNSIEPLAPVLECRWCGELTPEPELAEEGLALGA